MTVGPTVETERLILRPPMESDLPGWAEFMADEETARYVGGVQPPAMAWRGMAAMAGSWALRGFGMWSVVEKASGEWIGRLGPWFPEGWPVQEVGWGLLRRAQGRGYAYEGSCAAMDFAFDHLEWREVSHCIDPANEPSRRLAHRLGSRVSRLGVLPAPFESEVEIWRQTRDEWKARKARRS